MKSERTRSFWLSATPQPEDRRSSNEEIMKRKSINPYKTAEKSPLWSVLDRALSELEENQDIKITTHRDYVVGFLVTQCIDQCRSRVGKPKKLKVEKKLEPGAPGYRR
jgi:G:T/U-mismatch repair DNA glycosylase